MRAVANRAALAQRLVFEHKWTRLLAMTLRATFVESRHRKSAGWFEDVTTMRIMALHAIHPTLDDRMMLRQTEFRVGFKMALETGGRIPARIHNEPSATTTHFDVFAARSVTGFAPTLPRILRARQVHPRMNAGRKHAHIIGVTLEAGTIANIMRARNFGCDEDGARHA